MRGRPKERKEEEEGGEREKRKRKKPKPNRRKEEERGGKRRRSESNPSLSDFLSPLAARAESSKCGRPELWSARPRNIKEKENGGGGGGRGGEDDGREVRGGKPVRGMSFTGKKKGRLGNGEAGD